MIFLSGWSFRDIQPSSPLPIAIARGSWFAVKMASDWFFVPLLFQTRVQSQRALLLQGTESLNNATQSIERSQRLAAEAEHVGTDIIDELGGQREQLDRARDRVSTLGFASRYVFFFSMLATLACCRVKQITAKSLLQATVSTDIMLNCAVFAYRLDVTRVRDCSVFFVFF